MTDSEATQLRTIGAAAGVVAILLSGMLTAATDNIIFAIIGTGAGIMLILASLAAHKGRRMNRDEWRVLTGTSLGVAIGMHLVWIVELLASGETLIGRGELVGSTMMLVFISIAAYGWSRAESRS